MKAVKAISCFIGIGLSTLISATALSQVPADIRVERMGDAARIVLTYDEALAEGNPSASVQVEHTVLIAELSEPIQADISDLADQLGPLAARARLDPDGSTLRVALSQETVAEVSTSYNVMAIDLLPSGGQPFAPVDSPRAQREREAAARAAELAARGPILPPPADPVPVEYSVGQSSEYSRIEMLWPVTVGYELTQVDDIAEIRFSLPATIFLNRLSASPPRFLESASSERIGDDWILRLDLEDDVTARVWSEGGRVVIDLLDPDAAGAEEILAQLAGLETESEEVDLASEVGLVEESVEASPDSIEAEGGVTETSDANLVEEAEAVADQPVQLQPVEASPVPEDGIVSVATTVSNGDLQAVFNWEAPVGASVFRRGEAIWIVFDASAVLNLEALGFDQRGYVDSFMALQGADYSAVRIVSPETTQAEVRQNENSWTVVFSENIIAPPRPISIHRDASINRPGRLIMGLDGARSIHWVDDPVVGDSLAVVTAGVPVQGLVSRRNFIGGSLLSSAHGGAVEVVADDLDVNLMASGVVISRPEGLNLTPSSVGLLGSAEEVFLANVTSPTFMNFGSWKGEGTWREEWGGRQRRAALEEGPEGRISLAHFLLGNDLAAEALGTIQLAIEIDPQLVTDEHTLTMQGVASYMMGRYDDAVEYLSGPSLYADPGAQLWRGMVSIEQERWVEARRLLEASEPVAAHYTPLWQARFAMSRARAALEVGDFVSAAEHLHDIDNHEPDHLTRLNAAYISSRIAAETGDMDWALDGLERLSTSGVGPIEARALYDLYRLQLEAGQITRRDAIEKLENLRFRWRGDTIELATVRTLGELYIQDGAFAQGLGTMMATQSRFPDTEAGRRIGDDMVLIFRRLFLDGEADRLDPIQAVALFYEYQDMSPIGTDGDRMIRRLADRLIAFDLLDPAAELLQHQVEYRLREPAARARVATDLAVVYMMDRRYEDALNILRGSRVAGLPRDLVDERYLLEARALVELGQHEHALELVSDNRTNAANRLRADVSWDQQDWSSSGRRLESLLGNRWTQDGFLSVSEQSDLIRAAIAYSLTGDVTGSRRLKERYGDAMAETEQAAAFEVLTADDATPGGVLFSDIAGRIASIDTLDAFMEPFRARFSNTSDDGS